MPLLLLPPPYYFFLFKNQDCLFELHETYPKQTLRNRFFIVSSQGVMRVSIPVKRQGNKKSIHVEIDYAQNWIGPLKQSLDTCYNASPYFLYYKDALWQIFDSKPRFLFQLNLSLFHWCIGILGFEKDIHFTKKFEGPCKEIEWPLPKQAYAQVFDKKPQPEISVIDLLFNLGPESEAFLKNAYTSS